ncbi:MAG: hypothetical protein IJ180_04700 [Bacteroidales bacterium]|nr:hypothetical protein [Bacteroidales bacterium]
MKKLLIIICSFLLLSCGQKSNYEQYSSKWYSISYPKGWIVQEFNNQLVDVGIGKTNGDVAFSILHFSTNYSLEEVNRMGNEDLVSGGEEILSNKKTIIDGKTCYITEIYLYQKQISYTFKENTNVYNIKFTSPNGWLDENKDIINNIINSFKIK